MGKVRGYLIISKEDGKLVATLKGTQPRRVLTEYRRNGANRVETITAKTAQKVFAS